MIWTTVGEVLIRHSAARELKVLPALDIANGQVMQSPQVRASGGTIVREPLEIALDWQRGGAEWIHVVDLDAAYGRGSNTAQIAAVIDALEIAVELSCGVEDEASFQAALATGCDRIIVSSVALKDWAWCAKTIGTHGGKIAFALDVRDGILAARGVVQRGPELFEALARLDAEGCTRYVVTDVDRDGAMAGPNMDLLRHVCSATQAKVIASGGIATLDDLRSLAQLEPLGLEGVVVGSALHAGAFTLSEALFAVKS